MTIEKLLRESITYDSSTGILQWKQCRPGHHFKNEHGRNIWHSRFAGRTAGTIGVNGYRQVRIGYPGLSKGLPAHRVAWFLHFGTWPLDEIDHINHDRDDNRLINLRMVSRTDNARNTTKSKANKSGVVGVSWEKIKQRWRASISHENRSIILGRFADKAEAVACRKAAEIRLGYHENHGAPLCP